MKKKNVIKGLAVACGLGLCLAGCAPLSNIKDQNGNNINFDTPAYYQGQVARVGDYLFYGNTYADITASDFDYVKAASKGYLTRLNLTDLVFDEDVIDLNYKHSSPEGIEKVNGATLAGYANQEMFAFGQYLYFTSANIHKTTSLKNDFTRVSLFRIAFNGDCLQEIGTYTYDENSSITLQQGSDGNYYFVIVCPSETETTEGEEEKETLYDVFSVKAGAAMGGNKKIVSEAKSVVVADEDSTEKTVVYTYDPESENMNCAVKAVDFASGEAVVYDGGLTSEVALIARVGDEALYSYAGEIYYKNVAAKGTFVPGKSQLFYSASSISDVEKIGDGFVFKGTSALVYKEDISAQAEFIAASTEYENLLFADGDYVYLSNASAIIRKNVVTKESENLVSGMTIISGECGYDGDNIYFYAQRGKLEEVEEEETDSNYYLYQVDKAGNIQLLSKVI